MKRHDFRALNLRTLWQGLIRGDGGTGDRIVPPTGFTAHLTLFSAAAMAFLAVFALALALATGRLADRWSSELAQSVTVRVSAPDGDQDAYTQAVLQIVQATPGAGTPQKLPNDQVAQLLAPWFGPDMPVDALPVPDLIEVPIISKDFDPEGLRLRLEAEASGAVLDDHTQWRRPLVTAANRLRAFGIISLILIAAASASMITLAAKAALAANGQVIRVLRLIGARDITIATAFVRRFTHRAALGAGAGTLAGMLCVALLPDMQAAGGFLTGLGFQGWGWLMPLLIPVIAAAVGFLATKWAALRMLGSVR
ncbi:cell division protein FtsX [Paracoccus homiensis]|uniref:Cell division transport system permease protein n=1 Tax=Paracoccus homiensis TaxID=364199 RepID=A0A1I0EGV9_9RHOB|nr:cell division protein FtsX [Paracoccus homiensis]SET44477.1 cell division transport system permease protein [Paracoccus homiensis]